MPIRAFLIGLIIAFAPALAGAVVIDTKNIMVGDTIIGNGPSFPAVGLVGSIEFTNTDTVAMKVFATASGSGQSLTDLQLLSFGLSTIPNDPTVSNVFTSFSVNGGVASGDGVAGILALVAPGATFYLVFQDGVSQNVATTYAVTATAVPLPAAGWMLITAIAGIAFLGRRKTA